jgi:hypothetical protein
MALTELADVARRWADTVASGRTYLGTEKAIRRTRRLLATATSRGDRAAYLRQLAMYENDLAQLHTATFGPDSDEDDDGRDVAESLASSASLLRALADAESTTADWPPRIPARADIEQVAGAILDRIAATPDLTARRQLLEDLHNAVTPVVGTHAAETLASLPSPGYIGWRPGSERAQW